MNTNILEVKINSITILKNLARNLGVHIFEHIEDIAKLCIEQLLNDPYAMTIRKESTKCMRHLIEACREHPEKQRALFMMTYVRLMEEMAKRQKQAEFEAMNFILKMIFKMTESFKGFKKNGMTVFNVEDGTLFVKNMDNIVKQIVESNSAREAQVTKLAGKIDEEDMQFFQEDIEKISKGIHHVMEISGFLLQNMGAAISGVIATTLLPYYASVLQNLPGKKDYQLISSVCFVCDCLEYGDDSLYNTLQAQASSKFVEIIKNAVSKGIKNVNFDIVQSCFFGLGLVAQRQPNGQFGELAETMDIFSQLTNPQVKQSISEEQEESFNFMFDNAISSMVKVLMFQQDGGKLVT